MTVSVPTIPPPGLRLPPTRGSDGLYFSPRPRPGLRFTERMTGAVCPAGAGHATSCRHPRCRLTLTLTVIIDDVARFVAHPEHRATLLGTARWQDTSFVVTAGSFQLFVVDPDRVERREMRYDAVLATVAGPAFQFRGVKDIYNHPNVADAWPDMTTLHCRLWPVGAALAGPTHAGAVRVAPSDFARQLTTFRVTDAASMAERVDTLVEFLRFFAGVVLDTYGRILARGRLVTADAPPPPAATPRYRWNGGTRWRVTTADGAHILLTRFRGGDRGPVLLSPGFGMTSEAFVLDTRPSTLVEHLCRAHYDVWLLDYRASPAAGGADRDFTIDDVARHDYPAAVDTVLQQRARDGAPVESLLVVAHCIGALSLLMALLDGRLTGKIRFAVCSQLGLHLATTGVNETKAGLLLAQALRAARVRTLAAQFDARSWRDWLIDKLLRLYPSRERCNNPVCRRVVFLFGESYLHDRLDLRTHEAIRRLFGDTNLAALTHLSTMIRRGHAVDRYGEEAYLPRARPHLDIPLAFLHGDANRMFAPRSTERTVRWLESLFPHRQYPRKVVPGFGHLDCFVGRGADQEVFPWILEQLNRFEAPGRDRS
jgi:cholesterol oxidase